MQVAISRTAQGKANDANIPTPETILSNLRYDELYPPFFQQPTTYIRSSTTVEDCCGCPYNMTEEDDVFLKIFNEKRDPSAQCSEDAFEATMNFFEETAQAKQPFAAVDSPPVLSFTDMQDAMDAAVEDCVKHFAKDIYEHWKSRRVVESNHLLQPSLKVSRPSRAVAQVLLCHAQLLTMLCSLKPVKIPTIVIPMSASADVRFARSARLAAVMLRVRRSFGAFAKNWRTPGSWLHWCTNAR